MIVTLDIYIHKTSWALSEEWIGSQIENDAASCYKARFPCGCESVISSRGLLLMVAGVICFVKCYSGMSSRDSNIK